MTNLQKQDRLYIAIGMVAIFLISFLTLFSLQSVNEGFTVNEQLFVLGFSVACIGLIVLFKLQINSLKKLIDVEEKARKNQATILIPLLGLMVFLSSCGSESGQRIKVEKPSINVLSFRFQRETKDSLFFKPENSLPDSTSLFLNNLVEWKQDKLLGQLMPYRMFYRDKWLYNCLYLIEQRQPDLKLVREYPF